MEIKTDEISADLCVVTPQGEIDMGSSGELRDALHKITRKKVKTIVVSLEETSYIDSSGLATLIECLKKMEKYNGDFKLVVNTDKILNVFKLARLDMIFKIYADTESAKS